MLGWPELAALVDQAAARSDGPGSYLIYAENYGQAAAIEHLAIGRPTVASFADSYLLWVPDTLPANVHTLIYVNDEMGEDVQNGFADIQKIGAVQHPLARERGTAVWLCRRPNGSLPAFWEARVREVKAMLLE